MPIYNAKIKESELINLVREDFFSEYNTSKMRGNIDFCVTFKEFNLFENRDLIWAEAKSGVSNLMHSFTQLVLTIAKDKRHEKTLPPPFLCVFDSKQIAFVEFYHFLYFFNILDFNYNITPSDTSTQEFQRMLNKLQDSNLESQMTIFSFDTQEKELKDWIAKNLVIENAKNQKLSITKNNFIRIYQEWLKSVFPSILVDSALVEFVSPSDFYLADILSKDNQTKNINKDLKILLDRDNYLLKFKTEVVIQRHLFSDEFVKIIEFSDNQLAHTQFWNIYERPPKEEFWEYILERKDLLEPENIREVKGAFYTPSIWSNKAHDYLQNAFGDNYQQEYYIWDCAAGTGNLLRGLTESTRLFASTLNDSDVGVMKSFVKDRVNNLHLLESNIFAFDFLNDDFSKLPKKLQEVIKNEPHNLIILINPPYAEAASARQVTRTSKNKSHLKTKQHKIAKIYKDDLGSAINELFSLFFMRIYKEIPNCKLASFSTLKYINSANFITFRDTFLAEFKGGFMVPSFSFDNVRGRFPIGFLIWDLAKKQKIDSVRLDVYDVDNVFLQMKGIQNAKSYISQWYSDFYDKKGEILGIMNTRGNDFQNQNYIRITSMDNRNHTNYITSNNLIYSSVYFSVRHAIKASWINDRDQFLAPRQSKLTKSSLIKQNKTTTDSNQSKTCSKALAEESLNSRDTSPKAQYDASKTNSNKITRTWDTDTEFQNDCLAYMLFHPQNRISAKIDTNHLIPFSENELNAKGEFTSHFLLDFINGKLKNTQSKQDCLQGLKCNTFTHSYQKLSFSQEALSVLNAGKELYKLYHKNARDSKSYLNDAALYDIKAFFQGFNANGKMNATSQNKQYVEKLEILKDALSQLAAKIEVKIYEYGFLQS